MRNEGEDLGGKMKAIIIFFVGFFIGSWMGVLITALAVAAKRREEDVEG